MVGFEKSDSGIFWVTVRATENEFFKPGLLEDEQKWRLRLSTKVCGPVWNSEHKSISGASKKVNLARTSLLCAPILLTSALIAVYNSEGLSSRN